MRDLGLSKGTWPWQSERNRQAAVCQRNRAKESSRTSCCSLIDKSKLKSKLVGKENLESGSVPGPLKSVGTSPHPPAVSFLFYFVYFYFFPLLPSSLPTAVWAVVLRLVVEYAAHVGVMSTALYPAVPVGRPSAVSYLRWQSEQGSLL